MGRDGAWEDPQGVRWVLVPFWGPVSRNFHAPIEHGRPASGGVAAFKLEQTSQGGWRLTPAWLSRDIDMAEEVLVANGVVFAYGSGEDATQTLPDIAWDEPNGPFVGGALNPYAERRIPNSRHATIHAFDGQTGRELWSSGKQITSFNHFSGMTVANGRVYLGTFDGMLYRFGVPAAAAAR